MGLFGSRKKTKVDTQTNIITESKIVKFSYLQTLAVEGGLATAKDFAKETEASTIVIDTSKQDKDTVAKVAQAGAISTLLMGNVLSALGFAGVGKLFGKKTTVNVKATSKDSGWSLVKTWNQPQFDVYRYAIGIKDISLCQFKYEQISEVVSKTWSSPKEISKVTLYVDQFIPSEFPSGPSYIEYYVKPDIEEVEWIRINALGLPTVFNSDGTIVPRIISFNSERPVTSMLEEAYINTTVPVKGIKFKAVLSRPTELDSGVSAVSYTPILKSYKLLMTPKNGL